MIASRIEVIDPKIPEKPLARIVVPGDVIKEQIKKELRIGLTIKIDLGDKVKKKTVTVKVYDDELRKKIEEYVNSIVLRIVSITSEEQIRGEITLSEVRSEA